MPRGTGPRPSRGLPAPRLPHASAETPAPPTAPVPESRPEPPSPFTLPAPDDADSPLPPADDKPQPQPSPPEPRIDPAPRTSLIDTSRVPEAPAPRETPRTPRIDPQHFLDQLEAGARRALTLSRVTLHLRPPDLGTLHIAVESREGIVSAHFHASHPSVATWLESNAGSLRTHLSTSGLAFNDLSFSTASHDGGGRFAREQQLPPEPDLALQSEAKPPSAAPTSPTKTSARAADWRA